MNKIIKPIKLNRKMRKGMLMLLAIILCAGCLQFNVQAVKKNTWVNKSGKTYYYNAKGKKTKGLKKIKGKRYLFKSSGKLCGTGIQTYKKKYYYTKKGIVRTGLKTISKKTYYFTSKGPAKKGWYTYKGKTYYFGKKGFALTGKQKINGKSYTFSSKGVLKKDTQPGKTGGNQETESKPEGQKPEESKPEKPKPEKPIRPVEPEIQDPTVNVPVVTPVANTKENMEAGANALHMALLKVSDVEGVNLEASYPIPKEDCEPVGYKVFMEVVEEAKAIKKVTDEVLEEDRKWILVFDSEKGTFVNKQRDFDSANYPYTPTELFQEAEKLKAYREQRIVIQVEQVLTYYPEQSRAIFDAINDYRISKGVTPLVWSEDLSNSTRMEAGYAAYIYRGTEELEDTDNLEMHHMSQCGASRVMGLMTVDEVVQGWINSSVWHEPWLVDQKRSYGAVAYYTYNSATTGVTWSKAIYTIWSRDEESPTHAPEEYRSIILNCVTSNRVLP